jgi:hypothetical protein
MKENSNKGREKEIGESERRGESDGEQARKRE